MLHTNIPPTGRALTWQVLPASRFSDWSAAWRQLNEQGPRSPALDPRLIQCLIDAFGSSDTYLAVHGANGAVSAMALLRRRSPFVWHTFEPGHAPISTVIAAPSLRIEDLLPDLLSGLPGRPQLLIGTDFDPQIMPRPHDTATLWVRDDYCTRRITVQGDFEAYWQARPKKFRGNVKRRRGLLRDRNLEVRLVPVSAPSEMRALVEDHARLEAAGWKGAAGTAVRCDNASGRFYTQIMTELARTGEAIGCRLYYGHDLVATYLGIRAYRKEVVLKSAYDEMRSDTSPGSQMRVEKLGLLFKSGVIDTFDFYGSGAWQRDWSEEARTMYQIYCYRSPAAVRAHDWFRRARSAARRLHRLRARGGSTCAPLPPCAD